MDILSLSKYLNILHILTMSAWDFFSFLTKLRTAAFFLTASPSCLFLIYSNYQNQCSWTLGLYQLWYWSDHQDGYWMTNEWVMHKGMTYVWTTWIRIVWCKISWCYSEWHAAWELPVVYFWNCLPNIFRAWLVMHSKSQMWNHGKGRHWIRWAEGRSGVRKGHGKNES